MDYRCVLAIDAGYKNFAFCFVDTNFKEPMRWQRMVLWRGHKPPDETDIIRITKKWCDDNENMLLQADAIVLEKQMRTPFQVMNAVIHSRYFGKCEQVDARSIGAFWGLPKKRAQKKDAGIEVVKSHGVELYGAKQDDLADTWMMAVWKLWSLNCVKGFNLKRHGASGNKRQDESSGEPLP